MSQREPNNHLNIYLRLVGVAVFVLAAGIAGWILGGRPVSINETSAPKAAEPKAAPKESAPTTPKTTTPLYFHAHFPSGAARTVVAEEVAMASKSGIHQYVIDAPLPWGGDMDAFLSPIALVTQTDPDAVFLISVDLNAPQSWLDAHPDEAVKIDGKQGEYASLASEAWRREAQSALEAMISAMMTSERPERVKGYILCCLEPSHWWRGAGCDESTPNTGAFRSWLAAKYKDVSAFRSAWSDPDAVFETASVPKTPDAANDNGVFLDGSGSKAYSDYCEFSSDTTADVILKFTRRIKNASADTHVFATYGHTYELASGASGHFALSRLLDSEIDGFVSPVSYSDRGLGGVGGFMGPIHSALIRGKQWLLVDDTRTGLERDSSTGEITRPKNLRAEDVRRVQQRNFATALTQGLGLVWSDPLGEGWLHDPEMWQGFAKMWSVYAKEIEESDAASEDDANDDDATETSTSEVKKAEETPQNEAESSPEKEASHQGTHEATLAVVVDEASRFYERGSGKMSSLLLNQGRDCAIRAGMPTKFYLLRDVINRKAPPSDVYLFLNAFCLSAQDREQLHAILRENKSAAIWMYAPGYINKDASADNVKATTRINTRLFEGVAQAGSVSLLPADWIGKGDEFGDSVAVSPLFYIDDPDTNVLANFRASGKASVSVSFFEDGWASIFCAEPSLTPALLRQILRLLEKHLYFQITPTKFYDAAYFGENLMAIHAKETGERIVELEQVCDVRDMFSPEIGWTRKRVINIPMKTGETRLFRLTPAEEDTPAASDAQPSQ
jgi:hypothetical protein